MSKYRHAVSVFVVLGVVVIAAAIARNLAIPDTFGEFGHYRGAAPAQAREFPLRHVGADVCADCHDKQKSLHDKDAHSRVPCETCHGPGAEHVKAEGDAPMRRPTAKSDCLVCHQRLAARPGSFPQIDADVHFAFVGVKDPSTPCVSCHDPHEPLYMDRDVRTARLHPAIHRCRDCHQGTMAEGTVKPERHPVTFECNYCHPAIVADFAKRTHAHVACTTCHLYFRESEYAGRIIRDADPRFCLLCHRAAPFRSANAPKTIDWPSHRDKVASGPTDAKKGCVDCHRDRIHTVGTPVRGAVKGAQL